MDAIEAVVEVQAVRGAAGEPSPGSELAVAAEGGLRGGKVSLAFSPPLLWLVRGPAGSMCARTLVCVIFYHARTHSPAGAFTWAVRGIVRQL